MTTRSTPEEIAFLQGAIQRTEKEIKLLQDAIQRTEQMAANMRAEYGHGSRPSWVSADLADYGDRISRYKAEIERLEVK